MKQGKGRECENKRKKIAMQSSWSATQQIISHMCEKSQWDRITYLLEEWV